MNLTSDEWVEYGLVLLFTAMAVVALYWRSTVLRSLMLLVTLLTLAWRTLRFSRETRERRDDDDPSLN